MSRSLHNSRDSRVATVGSQFEAGFIIERDRQYLIARGLSIVVLALLCVFLPFSEPLPDRLLLAGLLIFVVVPIGTHVSRKASRERVDLAETVLDLVVLNLAVFLLPVVWTATITISGMMIVGTAPIQPRKVVVSLTIGAVIGYTISGIVLSIDYWYAPVIAIAVLMTGVEVYHEARRERLRQVSARYDALIGAAPVFFWEVDTTTRTIVAVAGNSGALLGYEPHELVGMQWEDVVLSADAEHLREVGLAATDGQLAASSEVRHRDGTVSTFRHLMTFDPETTLVKGVSSDINEVVEAHQRLRYQAEHDDLTGLVNRSVLSARLEELLRDPAAAPIALLVLDLDRFKDVNDILGHPFGDSLLTTLADRFRTSLPWVDVVARLGGDEFAILLTSDVDRESAIALAEHVVQIAEERMQIDGVSLSVSPSIGVALAPEHAMTPHMLMQRADIAMYEAKRSSSAYRVFENTPEELSLDRLTLTSAIRPALDDGQIELWYQPKVDIATQRIVGAEGLARWLHPERGVLSPADFLELITMSGEFTSFTNLVLRHGVQTAAQCQAAGCDLAIAINLAAVSFFDQDLPTRLHALLIEHNVAPDRIILEITESDILEEVGTHIGVFERLASLGVGLSIDDFGTGYSSLSRLRALPVTELKIDRSFIGRLGDPEDLIIVKTIVELSQLLGHHTVAEGVEDQATADALVRLGCQSAQGYLWAKPLRRDEFLGLLRTWPAGVGEHALELDVPFGGQLAPGG